MRVRTLVLSALLALIPLALSGCSTQPAAATTTATSPPPPKVEAPPPPEPEPSQIELSGKGQTATKTFQLSTGLTVFVMGHGGSSNFAVFLLDGNGNKVDLLANVVGRYVGAVPVGVKAGSYLLDITADGNWKITILQPRATTGRAIPASYQDKGPRALGPIQMDSGLARFTMKHDGESNFVVFLMNNKGQKLELLANEIGAWSGSKAVRVPTRGVYWLSVEADGNWQIDISK